MFVSTLQREKEKPRQTRSLFGSQLLHNFREMFASAIFATAIAVVMANNTPNYPSSAGNSYGNYPPFNGPKVPQNGKPSNASYPDDGCGDYSVRFKGDGYCYPVLKKGPCENVLFWITVDPYTYEVRFFNN